MTMINKSALFLHIYCYVIIVVNSSNHRIIENLKHIVDTAIENNLSDNDFLIEQLSKILEEEEGFRIVNHTHQTMETLIDGSGDMIEYEEDPPFYVNMSIITFPIVSIIFLLLLFHLSKESYPHLG